MLIYNSNNGSVSTFREPSSFNNGNCLDNEQMLISCQHENRRVVRQESDGTISVIADKFEGKLFNSPNDVAVKSDGSVWFTDPPYGILTNEEGKTYSIKDFIEKASKFFNFNIIWQGEGLNEVAIDKNTNKIIIKISELFSLSSLIDCTTCAQ